MSDLSLVGVLGVSGGDPRLFVFHTGQWIGLLGAAAVRRLRVVDPGNSELGVVILGVPCDTMTMVWGTTRPFLPANAAREHALFNFFNFVFFFFPRASERSAGEIGAHGPVYGHFTGMSCVGK